MDDRVKRLLCCANGAHTVMDAPRSESALRNLKPSPFSEDHVGDRNPHIIKDDFSMVVDVAEETEWAQDCHTLCISRNKNHGMLVVRVACACSSPQKNEDFALWAT